MKTVNTPDLTLDQLIELVRQLPKQDKMKLSKVLEKEGIESKFSRLFKTFRTDELSEDTINKETEYVREQMYERKKL
ncbi:MAG: hypothetical protein IPM96_08325 [Ignavibacteria bacterium]|nr:hypothetical protein [Ignavibacteria bacterium]